MANILEMANRRAKLNGVKFGTWEYWWNIYGYP